MSMDDVESSAYDGTPQQLFKFAMGNVVWGYVGGAAQTFTWNNVDYVPDAAIMMGAITQSLSESSPSVEIVISASSPVAQQFIPFLPIEPIQVWVYRNDWEAAETEYAPEFIGEIISSMFDENEGTCTLTARMVAAAMSRKVPWCVYSATCAYALYGIGCKVNRESFVTEAQAISGEGLTVVSAAEFASAAVDHGVTDPSVTDDWFRNGFARHVDSNEVRTIIAHSGTDITLHTPFTKLKNGDLVKAYAGCNRTKEHCKKKFNNLDNALLFPWVPTRNPYTQSVYGTATPANSKSKTDWKKVEHFINPATWNGAWGLF